MKVAYVYIEHPSMHLDHLFLYHYDKLPLQRGVRVSVPFKNSTRIAFVVKIQELNEHEVDSLTYPLKPIHSLLDKEPLINDELFMLANWMADYYIAPKIACFQCMLPSKLKPKSGTNTIRKEIWYTFLKRDSSLTPKQKEALHMIELNTTVSRKQCLPKYKNFLKKLIERGCIKAYEKEVCAQIKPTHPIQAPFSLQPAQIKAIQMIQESKSKTVCLLHGVTGSGKSEVFLTLSEKAIAQGLQVLLLVPEISLTPQMIERVRQRFANQVAIYHSRLNNQEKYEQYQLVKQQRVSIVVGTRSAIFMPFNNLGYIILDEEHDASYKQGNTPCYHTRDIAIQRANTHHAKVVLASATPSLESYARAHQKLYQLIEMPKRINETLPQMKVIEMRQAIQNHENPMLSNELIDAIQNCLNRKEQGLLLLNRRGYTPILRCVSCGYVHKCEHCDVAMSYHKEANMLKCHTCGATHTLLKTCPLCQQSNWRSVGYGTQRLQELIETKFKYAQVARMDADTTSRKNAHATILKQFENHEIDILIGTQMIAKGLDFENVTVVGILNADAALQRSDFRSGEWTYQLLEQASGRSGRGKKLGMVYLQVYDSQHFSIQATLHHEYKAFFKKEMEYRHLANYPPYSYLISLLFAHSDAVHVQQSVKIAQKALVIGKDCKVLGPALLNKTRDEMRIRILLKGKNLEHMQEYARWVYKAHIEAKQKTRLTIDVNPLTME